MSLPRSLAASRSRTKRPCFSKRVLGRSRAATKVSARELRLGVLADVARAEVAFHLEHAQTGLDVDPETLAGWLLQDDVLEVPFLKLQRCRQKQGVQQPLNRSLRASRAAVRELAGKVSDEIGDGISHDDLASSDRSVPDRRRGTSTAYLPSVGEPPGPCHFLPARVDRPPARAGRLLDPPHEPTNSLTAAPVLVYAHPRSCPPTGGTACED